MRSKLKVILWLTLVAVCANCDSRDTTVSPEVPTILPPTTGDLTFQDDLARGSTAGIDGYSGNPATHSGGTCSNCHSGGAIPTVTFEGPSVVTSGSTNTYMFQITGGQDFAGGLDVSVTDGTLSVNETGVKIQNGEVVQTTRRMVDSNGVISWTFDWTAPVVQADTTVTMYGAGLSVNGANGTGGDGTGTATLEITAQVGGGQPVANANGPYAGPVGAPIQFDSAGSNDPDGNIVTYSWDFGDGSIGTGETPIHTYDLAGSYTVTLTVTDNDSLQATDVTTAEIATPIIKQFRVPRKVGVTAGRAPTKTLTLTAVFTGVPGEEPLCGTAFLYRNGLAYQEQPICFTIAKSRASVEFEHQFTAGDAPAVNWLAYFEVNGVQSASAEETTEVTVR